jgi:hypothetical protein
VFELTSTEKVQVLPALTLPPVREIVVPPGFAVITLLEPQLPVRPLGLSRSSPFGSVSVKDTPVSEPLAFGLVIVNDSALSPPTATEVGTNALAIDGGLVAAADVAGMPSATRPALTRIAVGRPTCVRIATPFGRMRPLSSLFFDLN